jgi:hypothetical protein
MAREEEDKEEEEGVGCANELCACLVDEGEQFCSNKCRKASRSERPSDRCKCDHDDCEDDE